MFLLANRKGNAVHHCLHTDTQGTRIRMSSSACPLIYHDTLRQQCLRLSLSSCVILVIQLVCMTKRAKRYGTIVVPTLGHASGSAIRTCHTALANGRCIARLRYARKDGVADGVPQIKGSVNSHGLETEHLSVLHRNVFNQFFIDTCMHHLGSGNQPAIKH